MTSTEPCNEKFSKLAEAITVYKPADGSQYAV